MAFITEDDVIISFAEYSDVLEKDKRLFDSNEGLTDDVVEEACIRATERILSRLRSSTWWRSYYLERTTTPLTSYSDIPSLDPSKIISRTSDFTELCVYWALAEYILPQVADFGNEEDSEKNKMSWYSNRYEGLFGELIQAGDWYDFDDDGTVQSDEKDAGVYNLIRVR